MALLELTMQREAAFAVVSALATTGACQFIDLPAETSTAEFQRPFIDLLRRSEAFQRHVRSLECLLAPVLGPVELFGTAGDDSDAAAARILADFTAEEERCAAADAALLAVAAQLEALGGRAKDLDDMRALAVGDLDALFIAPGDDGRVTPDPPRRGREEVPLLAKPGKGGISINADSGDSGLAAARRVCGTIATAALPRLERVALRLARGSALVRSAPLTPRFTPDTCGPLLPAGTAARMAEPRVVFVVLLPAPAAAERVRKAAAALGATIVVPPAPHQRVAERARVEREVDELLGLLRASSADVDERVVAAAAALPGWRRCAAALRCVAVACGRLQLTPSAAVAKVWVPVSRQGAVMDAARSVGATAGPAAVPMVHARVADGPNGLVDEAEGGHAVVPPTHFTLNRFTAQVHQIVAAYGTARYKEINPTVLTIVTFPFLFGVMFGDIGHGLIVLCAGLGLLAAERWAKWGDGVELGEMMQMVYGGRHVVVLMGAMAVYFGLLYNDCFSLCISWGARFGAFQQAEWVCGNTTPEPPVDSTAMDWVGGYGSSPPFGIDPQWAGAENRIDFVNSVKMKHAVIVGVVQMLAGLGFAAANAVRRRDWMTLALGVVPEVVFLGGTFGYMCVLICIKWVHDWSGDAAHAAPPVLTTMTAFFLSPFTPVEYTGAPDTPEEKQNLLFPHQYTIQGYLLLISFVSIPLMLAPIPLMKCFRGLSHGGGGHGGDSFADKAIVVLIHTIEYVLGCVSNTASYLRLWALSLAHAQLSEVLWNFTFGGVLTKFDSTVATGVAAFFGFAVWFLFTLAILVGMEGLSAFLHTLRLHWVEFQNKFYAGDGVPFEPASLPNVLLSEDLAARLRIAEAIAARAPAHAPADGKGGK